MDQHACYWRRLTVGLAGRFSIPEMENVGRVQTEPHSVSSPAVSTDSCATVLVIAARLFIHPQSSVNNGSISSNPDLPSELSHISAPENFNLLHSVYQSLSRFYPPSSHDTAKGVGGQEGGWGGH